MTDWTIYHIYRCNVDHYEIEVTVTGQYRCPACGRMMFYVTSRRKKD
jgi:transcription initiation factor IIE alpha subunit